MAVIENVEFMGWPNCIRLSNSEIELIITTDIGPRIIRCGFIDGQNLFYVSDEDKGKSGGSRWRIYGGHRLWHAPEEMPRSYFPDNNRVTYSWDGKRIRLTQPVETTTGIIKEIEISVDHESNIVQLNHRLINTNLWTIETSVWPITSHAGGGRAIVPQEPYIDPAEYLLPARPLVLWYYTHMDDPRWIWGDKYIQMIHDPAFPSEQKIGILNKQGWAAYVKKDDIMIKRFNYDPEAQYPDYGCNNELYINGNFLEIETVGPVKKLSPGSAVEHTEHWFITRSSALAGDFNNDSLDDRLMPLVNSFGI